ncbi:hypothetical protein RSOLAG1IB_11857 [Rhizoctonia solani AG-1 IB]|uniref:Uncharacterized protein n=1 Tax=Thanatephorus cucumeris (strain AG1-IB / isolate 7/3/14) TaxID=1108050 RepID=A0A0B7FGY3_THACB|nr:hypothetical protein RSOLAG1IB_11857 [Rhizoctonia solani AG-1 IB]
MHQQNAHSTLICQTQPRTSHTLWKADASRRVSSRLGSQKKAWLHPIFSPSSEKRKKTKESAYQSTATANRMMSRRKQNRPCFISICNAQSATATNLRPIARGPVVSGRDSSYCINTGTVPEGYSPAPFRGKRPQEDNDIKASDFM